MSDLYNRIYELCQGKGISIGKMCKDLSISRGNLTELKMERIKTLKTENLTKISEYFGVSVDYLLGKEPKEKPLVNDDEELTEYLEQLRTRPELKMMFQLTKDATKEDVEKAVKVIEAMLGKD
ncbi:MAG TPA: helix-turn-helix domain-containing protein [Candidatus Agathobaculum stercoravium]|nr:helix-turn-helix domain-containing protein [Candidatus Agathobaculum stercoravium]